MYHRIKPHLPQMLRYLIGGFSAAGAEIGGFQVMLMLGISYKIGGPLSGAIGITTAFLVQKYFVFKKKENLGSHGVRYAILTGWNFIAQNAILFITIGYFHFNPIIAKVFSIGCTVSWNFFLYKFFVYV